MLWLIKLPKLKTDSYYTELYAMLEELYACIRPFSTAENSLWTFPQIAHLTPPKAVSQEQFCKSSGNLVPPLHRKQQCTNAVELTDLINLVLGNCKMLNWLIE